MIEIRDFFINFMENFMKDEFMFEGFGYWPSFNYRLVKFFFDFYRYQTWEISFDSSKYYSQYSFSNSKNLYKSDFFIYTNGKYYYSYNFDCFVFYDFDTEDFNNIRGLLIYIYDRIFFWLFLFFYLYYQIFLKIIYIYNSRPIDSSLILCDIFHCSIPLFYILFINRDSRKSFLTIQKFILLLFFVRNLFISRSSVNHHHLVLFKFLFSYGSLQLRFLRISRYKYDNYTNQAYVECRVSIQIFKKNYNFKELSEKKRRKIFNSNTGHLIISTRTKARSDISNQWLLVTSHISQSTRLIDQIHIPDHELDLDDFTSFNDSDGVNVVKPDSFFEHSNLYWNSMYLTYLAYYDRSYNLFIKLDSILEVLVVKETAGKFFGFFYQCFELIFLIPTILFFLSIYLLIFLFLLLMLLIAVVPVPIEFM